MSLGVFEKGAPSPLLARCGLNVRVGSMSDQQDVCHPWLAYIMADPDTDPIQVDLTEWLGTYWVAREGGGPISVQDWYALGEFAYEVVEGFKPKGFAGNMLSPVGLARFIRSGQYVRLVPTISLELLRPYLHENGGSYEANLAAFREKLETEPLVNCFQK